MTCPSRLLPPKLPSRCQRASRGCGVPIRDQIEMRWASLDDLLEADHPVRVVWAAVCTLDLKSWLSEIKAVEGHVGRDATDPRLLVALWVFATLKGIGSARELARLCEESSAVPVAVRRCQRQLPHVVRLPLFWG